MTAVSSRSTIPGFDVLRRCGADLGVRTGLLIPRPWSISHTHSHGAPQPRARVDDKVPRWRCFLTGAGAQLRALARGIEDKISQRRTGPPARDDPQGMARALFSTFTVELSPAPFAREGISGGGRGALSRRPAWRAGGSAPDDRRPPPSIQALPRPCLDAVLPHKPAGFNMPR